MKATIAALLLFVFFIRIAPALAQAESDKANFKMSLPDHKGRLTWSAEGFETVQASAKPKGQELGFRGANSANKNEFLTFLFLLPEQAPMSSLKCRDGILDYAKKDEPTLKNLKTWSVTNSDGQTIGLASYQIGTKVQYSLRAFIAFEDICGDMEFYSSSPINSDDSGFKRIFDTFRLDPNYVPLFEDVFLYAEILYRNDMFRDAAPEFELALQKLSDDKSPNHETLRRITTDNAGMAYGVSGNIAKARSIFEAAVKIDPDYALNYYNLACADAEENKLGDARLHLEQAFARKANTIAGESLPDPTMDDSFLPYKNNKEFWAFLEKLRG